MIHISKSLDSIDFSVLSAISFVISSVFEPKSRPQESDNIYVRLLSTSLYSYSDISLVVPSSSATIAILCHEYMLKKLDFPTFGLPIMVTFANTI